MKSKVVDGKLEKFCNHCKCWKDVSEFRILKDIKRDGTHRVASWCKSCESKEVTKWGRDNPEKKHAKDKRWRTRHPEQKKQKDAQYYLDNTDKKKSQARKWEIEHQSQCNLNNRNWRHSNPEKDKASKKKWEDQNPTYHTEYTNKRRNEDIQFKITGNLRSRLKMAVRGKWKSGSAIDDLGCDIDWLCGWLEMNFEDGMSWDNYGQKNKLNSIKYWTIDHDYPLSKVDLTDRTQLLKVCNWTNLFPLWSRDNIIKKDKIPKE